MALHKPHKSSGRGLNRGTALQKVFPPMVVPGPPPGKKQRAHGPDPVSKAHSATPATGPNRKPSDRAWGGA